MPAFSVTSMSTIDFTAQFLVYKLPGSRRPVSLIIAIVVMIACMVWGIMNGIFLFVFFLAPILWAGNAWRNAGKHTEVRELDANISVADDVMRMFVANAYLTQDGSRYVDHCYLCAREDLESITLDYTNMFQFTARFIRAFTMENDEVLDQFGETSHSFTFRIPDKSECQRLVNFLSANNFAVTTVS